MIVGLLSGCGEVTGEIPSTENPSKETSSATSAETASTETETFGRLFALSLWEGAVDANTIKLAQELAKPATLGLEVASEYKVFSDTAKTIPSPFGDGDTYTYEKSDCDFKDEKKEEYGSFYSVYDSYRNEDGDIIEVLHGTDRIGFYSGGGMKTESSNTIDETQAKEIAEEFLRDILPEIYVDSLTYLGTDDSEGRFAVFFQTEIEGYATDDDQVVWVTRQGTIGAYHGYDAMKYETLKENITAEKLEAAEQALEEQLAAHDFEELNKSQFVIVTNTSGEPYLSVFCSHVTEEGTMPFMLYTNIL